MYVLPLPYPNTPSPSFHFVSSHFPKSPHHHIHSSSSSNFPIPTTKLTTPKPAYTDAVSRSCANQNNKCADVANDPSKASEDLSVGACQTQSCMFIIPSNSSRRSIPLYNPQRVVFTSFSVLRGISLFFVGSFFFVFLFPLSIVGGVVDCGSVLSVE